jgi:hypothetical protein
MGELILEIVIEARGSCSLLFALTTRRFRLFTSAPFACFKASRSAVRVDYLTTRRLHLLASVAVKTMEAALPFGQYPL